jgi:hypothetical protein
MVAERFSVLRLPQGHAIGMSWVVSALICDPEEPQSTAIEMKASPLRAVSHSHSSDGSLATWTGIYLQTVTP